MTPSDRSEAIRRAQDGALKAANEGRWDHARAFLEYREEILKMDQSHLSAADSSAASGSDVPALPTLPGEESPGASAPKVTVTDPTRYLTCSNARRQLGLPYPRTCAKCGLGACSVPMHLQRKEPQ